MAAKLAASNRMKIKPNLSKSLTSLLECPVCMEFMHSPIVQCLNGHNICGNCKPRLHICPACRVSLTVTSRNVALENIAETCFSDAVTPVLHKTPSTNYRLYDCLAGKSRGCAWKGRRTDLWSHVLTNHERLAVFLKKDTQLFRVSNHDFSANAISTQLMAAQGQLFWYQFRQDCTHSKWYQAIQYIGPRKEASSYKYSLEYGPNPHDALKRSITYTRMTYSDEENIEHIFNTGDCFSVDLNSIRCFICENNSLQFKVKIQKS